MAVGQAAIVQNLQQRVPHLRVRLFDFIKEHHAVRTPTHGLGQLAAFLVAHVSGRGSEKTRSRVLLAVFGHINAHQRVLVVEQEFGQRFGELGFAYTGGAEEDKRTRRALGVFQAGAAAPDGVGQRADGFVLPDDALLQPFFHAQQLFGLGFQHLRERDAGPARNHLGDVLGVDYLVKLMFPFPLAAQVVELGF